MTTTSYVSAKLLARTGKGVLALRLTAPTTSAGKREAVSKSALVWEGVTREWSMTGVDQSRPL